MAYQPKTRAEVQTIGDFLDGIEPALRQAEARALVTIFRDATGYEPKVHSGGMVGFGLYAYRYGSGHSGVSLATGFAARKAELSIYILPGFQNYGAMLARLGPHRLGKACLYLRRLDAVDRQALHDLIAAGLQDLRQRWTVAPG